MTKFTLKKLLSFTVYCGNSLNFGGSHFTGNYLGDKPFAANIM